MCHSALITEKQPGNVMEDPTSQEVRSREAVNIYIAFCHYVGDKQDEAGRQLETVHQGGAKTSTTFSSSGAQ